MLVWLYFIALAGSEPSPLIIPTNSEKAENLSIFITPRFFREEPAKKTLSAPWTRRVIYVTCRMRMFKPCWGKVTFTARVAEVKKDMMFIEEDEEWEEGEEEEWEEEEW